MTATVQGLRCPACGGAVGLEEGDRLAACGSCGVSLLACGDVGHTRVIVPPRVGEADVRTALERFWRSLKKASDLPRLARVGEQLLIFAPVWRVSGRVVGWVLGDVGKGSGKRKRWIPVERRVNRRFELHRVAADLGELGVHTVDLDGAALRAFDPDAAERQGMVFQPQRAASEVEQLAAERFDAWGRAASGVERVRLAKLFCVSRSLSLVYYPLWVVRYSYRGRTYQATVDAHRGTVLAGRAPGNDSWRAAMLVAGTMAGAFLFSTAARGGSIEDPGDALIFLALGAVPVLLGFRAFRYGAEVVLEQRDPYAPGVGGSLARILQAKGQKVPVSVAVGEALSKLLSQRKDREP